MIIKQGIPLGLQGGVDKSIEKQFVFGEDVFDSFLKEKDPGFGGLVRVMNKCQEFMWGHERFAGEY